MTEIQRGLCDRNLFFEGPLRDRISSAWISTFLVSIRIWFDKRDHFVEISIKFRWLGRSACALIEKKYYLEKSFFLNIIYT